MLCRCLRTLGHPDHKVGVSKQAGLLTSFQFTENSAYSELCFWYCSRSPADQFASVFSVNRKLEITSRFF